MQTIKNQIYNILELFNNKSEEYLKNVDESNKIHLKINVAKKFIELNVEIINLFNEPESKLFQDSITKSISKIENVQKLLEKDEPYYQMLSDIISKYSEISYKNKEGSQKNIETRII